MRRKIQRKRIVPEGYVPEKPYITPKEMHYEEALRKIKARERIPRGTIITGFPEMPEVSTRKIKVTFLPSGEVRVPTYAETAKGELKVKRYVKVKSIDASIRMAWHQAEAITLESHRIDAVYAQMQGLHGALILNWMDFNPAQREAAINYTSALAGSLEAKGGKLTEPHKPKAIEKLNNAANLLVGGNISAAVTSLIGSANDLIERKNVLIREKAFLERRGKSIVWRKAREDRVLYEMLDRVINIDAKLTGPQPITDADIVRYSDSLEGIAKTLSWRIEPKLKQCAALSAKAANSMRAGNTEKAIPVIRLAKKTMVNVASESTVLSPERLLWVAGHNDVVLKKRIVKNQLKFFGDNVGYWLPRVKREQQRTNMHQYLLNLANALRGAKKPAVQREITIAADLFKENKIAECKGQIQKILPML